MNEQQDNLTKYITKQHDDGKNYFVMLLKQNEDMKVSLQGIFCSEDEVDLSGEYGRLAIAAACANEASVIGKETLMEGFDKGVYKVVQVSYEEWMDEVGHDESL